MPSYDSFYVPQLRTSFSRDLARTSDPLSSLQQDKNEVSRLRRGHRTLRFPYRQNHVCPGPEHTNGSSRIYFSA